ncbi:MAG: hypothetical protein V9F03_05580 [Microthrixaceae bacterium]
MVAAAEAVVSVAAEDVVIDLRTDASELLGGESVGSEAADGKAVGNSGEASEVVVDLTAVVQPAAAEEVG